MSFHVLSLLHWRFAHKCWVLKQALGIVHVMLVLQLPFLFLIFFNYAIGHSLRPPVLDEKTNASWRVSTSCRAWFSCSRSSLFSAASFASLRPPTAASTAANRSFSRLRHPYSVSALIPSRRCRSDFLRQLQCFPPLLFRVPFSHSDSLLTGFILSSPPLHFRTQLL